MLQKEVNNAFYSQFKKNIIQEKSIEPIINGKNIIISAGTGSGKTEAAIAPLISKYMNDAIKEENLFLLYISPTKALINDIEKRLIFPLSTLHLNVGIRHGDRDDLTGNKQINVLITTPESLDVMLMRKEQSLLNVKAIIIDEVHLFYNTQRGLQLSILINRLKNETGQLIQIVALSATIGNLEFVGNFLAGKDTHFEYLKFPVERKVDAQIRHSNKPNDFLTLIKSITSGTPIKILIFSNSRKECETLAKLLYEDKNLQNIVFTHYSSLSTEVRLETEKIFSSYKSAICIATSTLELGIDIGDIELVILWGVPPGISSFLQRIGRGNRRSKKNNVLCIVPSDTKNKFIDTLRFLNMYTMAINGEMTMHEPYELYGAIAQQSLSIIASKNGAFTKVSELQKCINNSYLLKDNFMKILSELQSNEFLKYHGFQYRYCGNENLYKLIDSKIIYGNFPTGSINIKLFHGSKLLGDIPYINIFSLNPNSTIKFASRLWRVKKINREGVHLEPTKINNKPVDISFGGNRPLINPEEINRIWESIFLLNLPKDILKPDLENEINETLDFIRSICQINNIPFINMPDGYLYFTFAGKIVNHAICLFLSLDTYETSDFSIKTNKIINWSLLSDKMNEFNIYYDLLYEETLSQSIYQKLLPLDLQRKEYIQSWEKNLEINRILTRLKNGVLVNITSEVANYFVYE